MSDLVENPEERFSHNEAHIKVGYECSWVNMRWACEYDVIQVAIIASPYRLDFPDPIYEMTQTCFTVH